MKVFNLVLATSVVIFSGLAHANTASDLIKVRHLADKKVAGADIRKTVTVFDNTNEENPCAPDGISYVVKVQALKSELKQMPDGTVGQSRVWNDLNTYVIAKSDLDAGRDINDILCEE